MFVASLKTLAPRLRQKLNKPIIENLAFKLHYQLTVTFLLLCGLIVCARELLGDHIKCFGEAELTKKYEKWIENYCFFMSTFTIKEAYDEDKVKNREIPHPGTGNPIDKETIQHTFYQWVPFVLFFQAICFYMPHHIWKQKEGGRIKALVDGLQYAALSGDEDLQVTKTLNIPSKKTVDQKLDTVKTEVLLRLKLNSNWSVWLITTEIMNLVNVILQVAIINRLLKGTFISLGANVIDFKYWNIANVTPLTSIFPKVTKCNFTMYGPSGTLMNRDVMCVMALNNVHEKIFTVLWFWFIGLFISSLAAVIWRVASIFFRRHSRKFSALMFQKASYAKLESDHVDKVVQKCNFGDWLFIYYLAKNMNSYTFAKLLKLVARDLDGRELVDSVGFKKIGFEPMLAQHNMGFDDEKKA